jgi:hypothetical protein
MKGNNPYQLRHFVYSMVMLMALAWLTVSLPVVYAGQQRGHIEVQQQHADTPMKR